MSDTLEADVTPQIEAPAALADPFSIDENALTSLAPEARTAFDSVVKTWRSKVDDYVKTASQKAAEEASAPYKDYEEQKKYATALRSLTADPRFVHWYQSIQGTPQGQPQQPPVASAEEYALAVQEAAAGNSEKLDAIIARKFSAMAAPTLREFESLKMQRAQDAERDSLFSRHADAQELDRQKGDEPSLLEMAVYHVVDRQGGTWEQAYQYARSIADAYKTEAKNAALGLVKDKKDSVTSAGQTQTKDTDNVIEVASAEEALRKTIEASMRGQKVTYVAKPRLSRK